MRIQMAPTGDRMYGPSVFVGTIAPARTRTRSDGDHTARPGSDDQYTAIESILPAPAMFDKMNEISVVPSTLTPLMPRISSVPPGGIAPLNVAFMQTSYPD